MTTKTIGLLLNVDAHLNHCLLVPRSGPIPSISNYNAELKDENKLIKLAKEMSMSGSDVHDLKIKINELVKDIDRCIDLLNE